ncbi:MAG TPA: GDSL-type esterase/lipase family protein [Bacteroidales bacterium]|nr:GDSL-type esterase/lipase family protein [Bacteroidales bacterium]
MKNFFLFLLFTLLIACNTANNTASHDKVTPEIKAWEPDIAKFEQLDKSETYPPDAIMFAGSSSIRLWYTLAADMSPYPVIQRGYGGAKLSDFAYYAHRIFDPHQCRAYVIFVANDITGNSDDKTPVQVDSLCNRVIDIIRTKHPDAPVFWISTTPTSSRWSVWPEIKQANNLIKETCESRQNTWFISTDTAYLNKKGMPNDSLFRDDRLHLNATGYAKWTQIIKGELNKVLETQ